MAAPFPSYPRTDGMTPSRPILSSSRTDGTVEFTGYQGLPSHFFSFSIYFEIDKYYPVWTGPDQARPVQDCQSGARSSPTFRLDRTGLSPTPDRVRPDWWNHCLRYRWPSEPTPAVISHRLQEANGPRWHYKLRQQIFVKTG
ncbi:hypothetical protein BDD12DRAFT_809208 [Trichophaea hybrida]|nr:hypothetical protein BDD12DRAFT_809208 [Trichophaea hybrida]